MKSIFVKYSCALVFLAVTCHAAIASNQPHCPNNKYYSNAAGACVCQSSCTGSPYIAQNQTTCDCYCLAHPDCNPAQWWDKRSCSCRCYVQTVKTKKGSSSSSSSSESSEAKTIRISCPAPLSFSNSTCGCECLTQTCSGYQVPFKPTCSCGCPDQTAEARCLAQSAFYSWNAVNCTCFSSLVGGVDDLFGFINFVLTNPDQAFTDINGLTSGIGFNLSDITGSFLNLTSTNLGPLANSFESILPPLAQVLIETFLRPIANSAVTLALSFTAATNPVINLFLNELVTNLPNSTIVTLLGNVVPSLFVLFQ